jgi:hypothetical protein
MPHKWYVPSYVVVRQAALKLGLDVCRGSRRVARSGCTPWDTWHSPRVVWSCISLPEYLLVLPRVSLSLGPRTS